MLRAELRRDEAISRLPGSTMLELFAFLTESLSTEDTRLHQAERPPQAS